MINKNLLVIIFTVVTAVFSADYIHYRLAQKYKEQGQYDLAKEEVRKVLSVYPDNYNAYFLMAEIQRIEGDYRKAIANYKAALKYNPNWSEAYLKLALTYEKEGDNESALQMLQKAKLSATDEELKNINSEIDRLTDRKKETKETGKTTSTTSKNTISTKTNNNTVNVPKGPTKEARYELDKAIKAYQKTARSGQNNYDEAITHIRKALAISPNYPAAYYYAGLIRRRLNQPNKAIVNFKKALDDPNIGYNAHFYLAKIYGEQGKLKEAIKEYNQYISLTSYEPGKREAQKIVDTYTQILEKKAADTVDIAEVSEKDVEQELKDIPPQTEVSELQIRIAPLLRMVIADTTTDEGQAMLKAVHLFNESKYDKAIEEFRIVLKNYPSGKVAAMTLFDLGITYMKLHNWSGAVKKFSLYRNRFPKYPQASDALFLEAISNFEMNKNSVAEKLFQQYIQEHRDGEWVGKSYEKLGDIYKSRDELKMAIDAYNLAIKHSSKNDDKMINLYKKGNVLLSLKNYNEALNSFKKVISIGEKFNISTRVPESYYKIADYLYKAKKYKEGKEQYIRVVRLYPKYRDTPWGLFQLGNIEKNLTNYDKAIENYDSLIVKYPEDYWAKQAEWKRKDALWQSQYGSK